MGGGGSVGEHSSPLGMPINTGDSERLVKCEEEKPHENPRTHSWKTIRLEQPLATASTAGNKGFDCRLQGLRQMTALLWQFFAPTEANFCHSLAIFHISLRKHIVRQGF